MPKHRRATTPFNPFITAQLRWPEWTFAPAFIRNGTEYIDVDQKLFLLDVREWGKAWSAGVAHALAHLALGHHRLDVDDLPERFEVDAADLAALWADTHLGAGMITKRHGV